MRYGYEFLEDRLFSKDVSGDKNDKSKKTVLPVAGLSVAATAGGAAAAHKIAKDLTKEKALKEFYKKQSQNRGDIIKTIDHAIGENLYDENLVKKGYDNIPHKTTMRVGRNLPIEFTTGDQFDSDLRKYTNKVRHRENLHWVFEPNIKEEHKLENKIAEKISKKEAKRVAKKAAIIGSGISAGAIGSAAIYDHYKNKNKN